jgi:hypothetical protein
VGRMYRSVLEGVVPTGWVVPALCSAFVKDLTLLIWTKKSLCNL